MQWGTCKVKTAYIELDMENKNKKLNFSFLNTNILNTMDM